jgi:glycosyltransferase involved in cell wall biosynthesis
MREIEVAQLSNSDLRPYRLPFLRMLRQRRPDISLTIYAGQALPGFGAPTEPLKDVPIPIKPVVNRFWPKGRHRVAWQSGALAMLRSDARVLICDEIVHNLTVWVIALVHRFFGKRLILIGFMTRGPGSGLVPRVRRLLLRLLRRSADSLISYTETGRRALEAEGWPMDRVFVSYNTLDTEVLQRISDSVTAGEVEELKTRLDIDGKAVLFLGKLIPEKHVEVIVDALALMADPPVLVVVGEGPERVRLESLASRSPGRVIFTGAIYDEHEVATYLALSEFLVLPGRVGLTCVHGFAAARPCITTGRGGVDQTPEFDYVSDAENAIVLADLRPQTHADAVTRLLGDPDLLADLQKGALATAQRLRMDAMVDGYSAAIDYAARPKS